MQFGMMFEKCVRKASASTERTTHYPIKNPSKTYISENWEFIWSLTKGIIDHLNESPIFYRDDEFTEEAYRVFYMDEGTTVYAAYDSSGKITGIIESNTEENLFVFPDDNSVNVGEIYVLPEYSRSGLAQDLLYHAESFVLTHGAAFLWVEHGTSNPNARGVWNKYFHTYQYLMARRTVL